MCYCQGLSAIEHFEEVAETDLIWTVSLSPCIVFLSAEVSYGRGNEARRGSRKV